MVRIRILSLNTQFFVAICLIFLMNVDAVAKWSDDSLVNFPIVDAVGSQVVAKICPTTEGGCYVSWYDGGSGYDVRLQRLDRMGNELWPHNGVLVADLGMSWVQDYGLDCDSGGNAIITFLDDRFGDIQVTANLVDSSGTMLWGLNGEIN